MKKNHSHRMRAVIAGLALIALACNISVDLGTTNPTQTPFQLPTGIPSLAASATIPPEPVALDTVTPLPTPGSVATEETSQAMAEVQDYYEKGYLPFQNGQLYLLDDFSKTTPLLNVFEFTRTGQQVQEFALWADIELDTTGSTSYPDYTGCGFAYLVQNNSDGYTAILTNEAVRMGYCKSGMRQCDLFGTTFGTGNVSVPNKTKTQFSFAVNKNFAYVLVDGILVGQYTLFTTKLLGMGEIDYAVVSNINAGYWTSCKISNVRVWESNP